jgi:hypothetical protein
MKGGTRVNNCVPAESVNEMDKSQTPPGRDGSNDSDAGKKEYTAKATTPEKVAKHGEKILNKELNKKPGVAEGPQEDAKFTPRLQIRSQIETALDQYLDPEKVAGAYTDIQYYKHDGKVYVEVLFNYTDGQKIGPEQRKQFLVNKDFTLTPIKKQGVAEEYELAGVGVAYELGRRAYKERKTARDNPYSATREARKNDEWAKGLERGKHDANDARHFRSSVREQGMAEAGDSNFVGFMNKTLADKVDAPKADPMAGAPDFYRNAAVSTLDARRGFKNALKFGLQALSRLDPETRQQLAAGSEQAVANYLTDVAERSGQMGDNTFVEEDITEVQDYLGDVFHDPSINSWKDVLQQSQGMSDGQLDEKSVSQAQFRTMAAAAHNPEFAKKVGISRDVAKEFNQADKGSNYKKLPDRATEGEQQKGADYRDPPEADYGDDYQDMVARMKKLAGLGPLKTVYDPVKRVYRNMPTAVQPKK